MRISDCSSDVCSSDLTRLKSGLLAKAFGGAALFALAAGSAAAADPEITVFDWAGYEDPAFHQSYADKYGDSPTFAFRSEEHTSELQSLMRISYAVFCLKKKKNNEMSITELSIHQNK